MEIGRAKSAGADEKMKSAGGSIALQPPEYDLNDNQHGQSINPIC